MQSQIHNSFAHVSVIIPALNEEDAIGYVVTELKALQLPGGAPIIQDIIVCDNGSQDQTAEIARENGARVVTCLEKGYGAACLKGIEALQSTDIVLFVDGDHSCRAEQAIRLILPIVEGKADLVIGSRPLGVMEKGALTPPQRLGNLFAVSLIRWLWRKKITDLGPFRAIRCEALRRICMKDRAFGWTVEMQVKAFQHSLEVLEVPVDSICRIGQSKISGTLKGVFGAGFGILGMIAKLRWHQTKYLKKSNQHAH